MYTAENNDKSKTQQTPPSTRVTIFLIAEKLLSL